MMDIYFVKSEQLLILGSPFRSGDSPHYIRKIENESKELRKSYGTNNYDFKKKRSNKEKTNSDQLSN